MNMETIHRLPFFRTRPSRTQTMSEISGIDCRTAVAALEETSALARHMAQHAGVAGDTVAQQSRTADWAAGLARSLRERFEEAPDSASRT